MIENRTATLIAEAKAMRYSRRTVMKRASAMGLSAAAMGSMLTVSAQNPAVTGSP